MFEQFTCGYLGFIMGLDKETIIILQGTGAPIYHVGELLRGEVKIYIGAKGLENLQGNQVTSKECSKKYMPCIHYI